MSPICVVKQFPFYRIKPSRYENMITQLINHDNFKHRYIYKISIPTSSICYVRYLFHPTDGASKMLMSIKPRGKYCSRYAVNTFTFTHDYGNLKIDVVPKRVICAFRKSHLQMITLKLAYRLYHFIALTAGA